MERFARSKDAEIRQALKVLDNQLAAHRRCEPRKPEEENGPEATQAVEAVEQSENRAPENAADNETTSLVSENDDASLGSKSKPKGGGKASEAPPVLDPFTMEMDQWCLELERLEALKEYREKQRSQLLGGLGGFRELDTPEAEVEMKDVDGDVVPFPLKTDPLIPASELLGHKKVYQLFRANFVIPTDNGEENEPKTVPLFFELDADPGSDWQPPSKEPEEEASAGQASKKKK